MKVVLKQKDRSNLMNKKRDRTETFETDISSRRDSLNNDNDFISHLMQHNNFKHNKKIEDLITV